ncbi:MAG TPA: DUF4397 domain-containing protein [Actinomycetota bacterium]
MRKMFAAALAAVMAFALAGPASAATDGPNDGTVTVVHAVPGLTVDVYLNDGLALPAFEPGTITAPIELPAADYTVDLRAAGADASSDPALSATIRLAAGSNVSWVAHLDAAGDPTLSAFKNKARPVAKGAARLTVRHAAAAGPVDVFANGSRLLEGFANGDQATVVVPKGIYAAWVAAPGDHAPVIGPAVLKLRRGMAYAVYAWGDATSGFGFLVQSWEIGTK